MDNDPKDADKVVDEVENQLVAFAENIGWFLGTVQNKAEALVDRDALSRHVTRIRDGATDLLKKMNASRVVTTAKSEYQRTVKKAADPKAKPAAQTAAQKASRAPVAAPGKKHRKPPPKQQINKRMGEVQGKKMGKKSVKNAMRGRIG